MADEILFYYITLNVITLNVSDLTLYLKCRYYQTSIYKVKTRLNYMLSTYLNSKMQISWKENEKDLRYNQ